MSYVDFILEGYNIRCFGVGRSDQNGQLHGVGCYPESGMGTGIGPGVGPIELPQPREESFTGVGHARGLTGIKHGLGIGISEGGGQGGIFTEEGKEMVNTVWWLT